MKFVVFVDGVLRTQDDLNGHLKYDEAPSLFANDTLILETDENVQPPTSHVQVLVYSDDGLFKGQWHMDVSKIYHDTFSEQKEISFVEVGR
jgi:hypothetical protein